MNLSKYLFQHEVTQLNQAFENSLQDDRALVFWTGVSPNLAKEWACKNGLKTLTMAMGLLYSDNSHGSLRSKKSSKSWSKYMKGASWIFAQQACHDRYAIVLTNEPPNVYSTRECSNYRDIEEPILKGAEAGRHTIRIEYVHPKVPSAARFRYQVWPDNRSSEWLSFLECIVIKDMFKKIVQRIYLQRSEKRKEPGSTKQKESENFILSATSAPDSGDKNLETVRFTAPLGQRKVDRAQQTTQKAAKRLQVQREQQAALEKRAAKRLRVEREQQAALEKRVARRVRVEKEQQAAQEEKKAKRLQVQREQQAALEKRAAKRLRVEREQQAALEKRAAKRLRVEREQQAAQEKREAKRVRVEKEQQAALEKREAKLFKTKALSAVISNQRCLLAACG